MGTFIDLVRYPFFLFSIIGIQLFDWNPEQRPTRTIKIVKFICGINWIFTIYTKINYALFGDFDGYKEVTLFVSYGAFLINCSCKFLAIWHGRHVFEKSFQQLQNYFPQSPTLQMDYRLDFYFNQNQFLQKMQSSLHFGTVTLFNFLPLLESLYEYFAAPEHERVFIYRLSYMLRYPFDETNPIIYPFAYLQQCLAAFCLSCIYMGSDLLLLAMVSQLNMHFEYLSKRILALRPKGTDEDIEELSFIISYHKDILLSVENIERTFSPTVLLNFGASSFCICMMAVQIVSGADGLTFFKFMCFLIAAQVHVYYICAAGSKMIEMSTDISDAFCHHRWYMANIKYQKMIVLAIARAQKPATLTANKFFVVSMMSFQQMLTTSYQFFTLLSSTLTE